MHIRRLFLENLRTQLQTLSGYGGVWIQRSAPTRNMYPCFTLHAESETVETLSIHGQPRPQDRVLTVTVNAWIRGTVDDEQAESDMDAAGLLIESILVKPVGADEMSLIATEFKVSEEEPEIHVISLTYNIIYSTTEFSANFS